MMMMMMMMMMMLSGCFTQSDFYMEKEKFI